MCSFSLVGKCLTENFLHLLVSQDLGRMHGVRKLAPTLELASVRLFKVVDLPELGFPTRPMSGSRGIIVPLRIHYHCYLLPHEECAEGLERGFGS